MRFTKFSKFAAVLIAVTMILSLTSCGGGNTASSTQNASAAAASTQVQTETTAKAPEPFGKYDPAITVTAVKGLSDIVQKAVAKQADVIQNNIWSAAYEKDLGIKVDYLWTTNGGWATTQYEQKLNVAISANDLPDIIPSNQRQLKLLVDSGVAADMTQIFKDYAAPFTMEMMEADNNTSLNQATFDGKLMALPGVAGNIDNASMIWIRADWLKNLNMQAPKTMTDLLKISEAFTKNDPDKNGKNDTYGLGLEKGLFGAYADLDGFMEGYHAYANNNNGWINDASGKLVYGGIQPEVKTALAQLAAMYKDGQIDKEFAVKDGTKVAETIVSGKVGIVFGQHWLPFWPFQDCKNKDPNSDWKAYPIVSIDDKSGKPMINGSATLFFVINKNMKNPEAAVKLYNYYYAKDPALSKDYDAKFHGLNGEQETVPGQNWEMAVITSFYPLQNVYIHRGVKKYFVDNDETMLDNAWVKDNIRQIKDYQAGDIKLWSTFAWSGIEGGESINDYYDVNKLFQQNAYIKADTQSMTEKGATLKQIRDEAFTKIIMGTAPITEFDTYVDKWHKLGGDDITAEVNAAK